MMQALSMQKDISTTPMIDKVRNYFSIFKVHWKEIITISVFVHFLTDLLIIGPAFYILGAVFGLDWIHAH